MAFFDLQLKILFILVSFWTLSLAADGGHDKHGNDSSPGVHDFNRTVVLNSASEHYLAMIFRDYSDNATEKISAATFKDLLRDLNLGEKVSVTKSSSSQESPESRHRRRHARSYEQQASEFAGGSSYLPKRKEQLNFVSRGSPAKSRDRKRRNMRDNQYSQDDHKEVRLDIKMSFYFVCYLTR